MDDEAVWTSEQKHGRWTARAWLYGLQLWIYESEPGRFDWNVSDQIRALRSGSATSLGTAQQAATDAAEELTNG